MSNSNKVLKGWEERVISHEKGNRVVQYRLVDKNGNSLLAVVGSERGQRHMTYTVKGDFLRVLGPVTTVPAGTRWKSRNTVVEFLSLMTSAGGPVLTNSKERKINSATHPKKAWMARFSSEYNNPTYEEWSTRPAAEVSCDLHQRKKAHVENKLALWDPQSSSKAEGSREAALLSPGPSASGDKKATSSATMDYKPRKRIAGVEPNGSSAASGVSLNNAVRDPRAGKWFVPRPNVRRA